MFIFNRMDDFLAHSSENFILFIVIGTIVGLGSLIIYGIYMKKIRNGDDHTLLLKSRVGEHMFYSLLFSLVFFLLFVPSESEFYRQYMFLPIIISILVGAISSLYIYRKHIHGVMK
ncbi:magnesium-transporting ATPase (P-type) [Virgibacillus natechei]|uniref:Magnesium-transporting ATPase (P-type) n=1 Tax=Virgibacillus natechei TaxID=1216297 RepID=A0ABS4IIU6_9BACI|nr:hypothetical protein [Virgibacillus natechei]MBP1970266.1 magnesium-transporting ATPase (P-type) [Virgibacillus natechei]UZD12790.1 hypothetical protein OLD84_18185 [Virgibacillus natechei]